MKKKFLDKNLILEGFSQLKLPGLIFLVLSVLCSGLGAALNVLNYQNNIASNADISAFVRALQIVNIQDVAPILLPVVFIAPFTFCLVMFSFLNNRKGSDFYHAISSTRVCLFFSFTLSVLIWLALIIVPTVFSSSIIFISTGMIFSIAYIPYVIFTFLAASVLITACMLFAMSITGTVFSNIILFGLFLFLPRFAATFMMSSITEAIPILPINAGGPLNIEYNIPADFIYQYFYRNNGFLKDFLYTCVPDILYTFILAIIYLAVACLLFHYRKTETAGSSAPNKILQHIYRCLIALPTALLIPILLLSSQASNYSSYQQFLQSQAGTMIFFIVVTILIYFLYELLTTKSIKKMFRSSPLLIAVAAFCILFGVILNGIKSSYLIFSPSGNEIQNITILPKNENNRYPYSNNEAYTVNSLKNLPLNSSAIKNIVSEILSDDVRVIKTSKFYAFYENTYTSYYVGIKLANGSYHERFLYASKSLNQKLKKALYSNKSFFDASTALPDEKNIDIVTTYFNNLSLSIPDTNKIWQSYRTEYATLINSAKLAVEVDPDASNQSNPIISVYSRVGIARYKSTYVLNGTLPKTKALYISLINSKNKENGSKVLSRFVTNGVGSNNVEVIFYNCDHINEPSNQPVPKTFSLSNWNNNLLSSQYTKVCAILKKHFDEPVNIQKPYVYVILSSNNSSVSYYQAISIDSAKKIKALVYVPKR